MTKEIKAFTLDKNNGKLDDSLGICGQKQQTRMVNVSEED